jgi:lysozyme family protein
MNFTSLEKEYTNLISTMEVRPEWKDAIDRRARAILANKSRYQEVSATTGVPWMLIGVIHSMESGLDFNGILHNGEKIIGTGKKTKLGPKGRGPFSSWEEAAQDALTYDGLDKITDWSDEQVCYALEKYNGFGYRTRNTGVNSPYLWSGSNHYTTGKFVEEKRGGKIVSLYKPALKSGQTGAFLLFKRLSEIDVPQTQVIASSSKLSMIKSIRGWFAGISLGGIVAETLELLQPIKEFIIENKFIFVGVTVAGVLYVLTKLLKKGVKEYQEGRYIPSGQKQ